MMQDWSLVIGDEPELKGEGQWTSPGVPISAAVCVRRFTQYDLQIAEISWINLRVSIGLSGSRIGEQACGSDLTSPVMQLERCSRNRESGE
jgi:hypothetical protein